MTEVDSCDPNLSNVLSSLDQAAKRLNSVSNNANAVITSVEVRLLRANLGLEVWWDQPIMPADASSPVGDETSTWASVLLGFAKVNEEWCLAVKVMRYGSGFDDEEHASYTSTQLLQGPVALKRTSRDVRLAALKALPDFLVHLTNSVKKAAEELEAATQLLAEQGK